MGRHGRVSSWDVVIRLAAGNLVSWSRFGMLVVLGDLWEVRGNAPGRNLDGWPGAWWCLSPKRESEDK